MLKQYVEAIEKNNIVSKTDINGIITFVNDEFCKISGYSKDELIGFDHNIVRHPDVPTSKFKILWDTILAKKTYKATVKNLAKDNSTFYVNTTIIPIINGNGDIEEFAAIRYDVTDAVNASEELMKKDKELELLNETLEGKVVKQTKELRELNLNLENRIKEEVEKNREKDRLMFQQARLASMGEMIANIAHQWRQPLWELNILLYDIKKVFKKYDLIEEIAPKYEKSKILIKKMSQTIDDFRDFFKPNKAKEFFSIKDVISETLAMMTGVLKSENIQIETQYIDNADELKIEGYANEFSHIIINIINNAKDAFKTKKQDKKLIQIIVTEVGSYVKITFCDNAGGIEEDILENIFDPYFTTKHKAQGTGLGLYMCKMIIENSMYGSIDACNINNGVCFSITLKGS